MITSANTSVNKKKVPQLFKIIDRYYGWGKYTKNFDIGGGKWDTATKYLKEKGVDNYIYDPYNRDDAWNLNVKIAVCDSGVETVTLSNVLNVVQYREHRMILLETAEIYLKIGGHIYINVYEGDKSGKGKRTKKDCWQENKPLKAYLPLVKRFFKNARIEHGIIVATKEE